MENQKNKTGKKQQKKANLKSAVRALAGSARVGGSLKKDLSQKSHYLRSLLDPLNTYGAKIPDDITQASTTAHCIQRVQQTAGSDGICALAIQWGSLGRSQSIGTAAAWDLAVYANSTPSPVDAAEKAAVPKSLSSPIVSRQLPVSTKPVEQVFPEKREKQSDAGYDKMKRRLARQEPGPLGAAATWTTSAKVYSFGINAAAGSARRIVSGAIHAFNTGSDLQTQGRFCIGSDNRAASNDALQTLPINGTQVLTTYQQASDLPVASPMARDGRVIARYIPSDANDLVYGDGDFMFNINSEVEQRGMSIVLAEGLTPGTVIEFWVVENYELIPSNQVNSLISPTPSPNDPLDMAITQSALSDAPNISVLPPPRAIPTTKQEIVSNMPPNGHAVGVSSGVPEKGVMDSMFDLIEKGIGYGDKVAKLAGPALPLLAALL